MDRREYRLQLEEANLKLYQILREVEAEEQAESFFDRYYEEMTEEQVARGEVFA